MTRADGLALEKRLTQYVDTRFAGLDASIVALKLDHDTRFAAIDEKTDAQTAIMDARFEAMDAKLDAVLSKLTATAWTVGGVAVGILVAIKYLG